MLGTFHTKQVCVTHIFGATKSKSWQAGRAPWQHRSPVTSGKGDGHVQKGPNTWGGLPLK